MKKCSVVSVGKGRIKEERDILTPVGCTAQDLYDGQTYKYLGVHETITRVAEKTRRGVEAEYLKRVEKVWTREQDAKTSTRLHNTWAAPKLRYYVQAGVFGKSHMQKLDRQTRAILRNHKSHESLAATERLYMTSTKGGRGITNMPHMWERAVVDKLRYLEGSQDERLKGVLEFHKQHGGVISLENQVEAVLTKYEMTNAEGMTEKGLKRLREKRQGHLRDSLVRKKFHEVHQRELTKRTRRTKPALVDG